MKKVLVLFAICLCCIIVNAQNEKIFSPAKDNIVYFVSNEEGDFVSEKIVDDSIILNFKYNYY
ncbi:hypothetical protein J2X97_001731 [Epilithonimonas hungarica]|uniref:hypothetical protein n=1 Tax=Epilithonimonas hungarica TaxID=454006 RepID=UPI002782437C|nr:hypothetical protein [Epilithonimonas hungarica]MDP9956094.1 hypothetical protein [Epilithonimonas hungarica]